MKIQIYASDIVKGKRQLVMIDEREGELGQVVNELLNCFWEEETTGHPSMLVTDATGKLLASLTMIEWFEPVDGLVEVYYVGGIINRWRVTYIPDANGGYDHTEIMPVK